MRIAVGSDHAGFRLKSAIVADLEALGHQVVDVGTHGTEAVDYPEFVFPVAEMVARGEADVGIFPCGSGIGPCMAANKVPGVRALVCHDVFSAKSSRRDNNANFLTLGERVIGTGAALEVVRAWLAEPFTGVERHQRRLNQIEAGYQRYCRDGVAPSKS